MSKNAKIALGFFVFGGLWLAFGYYSGQQLIKHHTLTIGKIEYSDGGGKGNGGPGVHYIYLRDGEWIKANDRKGYMSYDLINNDKFDGHYFPVVYRKGLLWYDTRMLINPLDFRVYGYPFPDSLQWVMRWVEEGGR